MFSLILLGQIKVFLLELGRGVTFKCSDESIYIARFRRAFGDAFLILQLPSPPRVFSSSLLNNQTQTTYTCALQMGCRTFH